MFPSDIHVSYAIDGTTVVWGQALISPAPKTVSFIPLPDGKRLSSESSCFDYKQDIGFNNTHPPQNFIQVNRAFASDIRQWQRKTCVQKTENIQLPNPCVCLYETEIMESIQHMCQFSNKPSSQTFRLELIATAKELLIELLLLLVTVPFRSLKRGKLVKDICFCPIF
jgi:hypothetical protein